MSQQRGLFSSLKLIGMCESSGKEEHAQSYRSRFLRETKTVDAFKAQRCNVDDEDACASQIRDRDVKHAFKKFVYLWRKENMDFRYQTRSLRPFS